MGTNNFPWKKIGIVLSLCLLLFLLPPFLQNGLILGHDTFLHSVYIHKFIDAFFQGQIPVRVIDWIFPGANAPIFNFYQPGFYYLVLFVKLLGFSYSFSVNSVLLALWIFSGVFMYLFVKERFGKFPGIFSALLFVFAPYHIVDIYVRTAFPEFAALAFFPAIFWTATRFAKTQKRTWLLFLSLFTGIALLCHPPTFVMFAPLIGVYTVFLAYQHHSLPILGKTTLFFFIGVLLVSFFILPALLEQRFVHMELAYTDKLFDFHNHFVCIKQLFQPSWGYGLSVKGCKDDLSFQVGIIHWIAVAISIGGLLATLFLSKQIAKRKEAICAVAFFIFFIWSLFMTLPLSLSLWEHIPYLRFVEFPWRFLALGIFTASFLAGYALSLFPKKFLFFIYMLGAYGIFYLYIPYLHASVGDGAEFDQKDYLVQDPNYQSAYYSPQQTFFPKAMKSLIDPKEVPGNQAKVLQGKSTVTQTKDTATEKVYVASGQTPSIIRLYVHYFPGWTVYKDGVKTTFSITNAYAFPDIRVPSGTHELAIIFEDTPVRRVGNWLSLVSLLLLLFLSLRGAFKKNSER